MSLYLDTSLVVALLIEEPSSERVRAWIAEQAAAEFSISWWVETEVASALSKKVRERLITAKDRDRAMRAFAQLVAQPSTMLAVTRNEFKAAEGYCLHESSSLRSADALHLAVAAANNIALCTLDKRLAKAGLELNIATQLV